MQNKIAYLNARGISRDRQSTIHKIGSGHCRSLDSLLINKLLDQGSWSRVGGKQTCSNGSSHLLVKFKKQGRKLSK